MKKFYKLCLLIIVIFLFACSKNEKKPIGMPNPMVSVTDENEFMDILGIKFMTSYLPKEDFKQYIISKKVGDARFTVDGKECMFRCTKDIDIAKKLSGIYDADMKKIDKNIYFGDEKIDIYEAPNEGYMIYSFSHFGDTYYELAVKGELNDIDLNGTINKCLMCAGLIIE